MFKPLGPSEPFPIEAVQVLRRILKEEKRHRDLALFCVGIDTCLRSCDLLTLRVGDVRNRIKFRLIQKKTGDQVECRLKEHSLSALKLYLAPNASDSDWLFPGRNGGHLTRTPYWRLVKDWQRHLGWAGVELPDGYFGTHSVRRSFVTHFYDETKDLVACQVLLGHRKIETTIRYLGVGTKRAHELAEQHPF